MENERNDYSELVVTYCFNGLTQKDLQQQRSLQAQLRLIEHEELMREESLIKRRLLVIHILIQFSSDTEFV